MLNEFKKFAMKGNVIDMAVGIIIGGAFTGVVQSVVKDLLMPPLGLLIGNIDFSDIFITLRAATETSAAVTLNVGLFVNATISFLILAFAVFLLVKNINKLQEITERKEKQDAAAAEAAAPSTKECPRCYSTIPIKATRCPHCTSEIG
ncbi:MAG: MscL: large-conductance mechanosensitive channel [Bacteroidota bacterium]|jgi:large conductance mechanosensitive channel